jgi:hypothetical protein
LNHIVQLEHQNEKALLKDLKSKINESNLHGPLEIGLDEIITLEQRRFLSNYKAFKEDDC